MAAAPGRHGGLPGNQHYIVVLLRSCVCLVEGGSLVEATRGESVRKGMRWIYRGCHDMPCPGGDDGATLSYKKWLLMDQLVTRDAAMFGKPLIG